MWNMNVGIRLRIFAVWYRHSFSPKFFQFYLTILCFHWRSLMVRIPRVVRAMFSVNAVSHERVSSIRLAHFFFIQNDKKILCMGYKYHIYCVWDWALLELGCIGLFWLTALDYKKVVLSQWKWSTHKLYVLPMQILSYGIRRRINPYCDK